MTNPPAQTFWGETHITIKGNPRLENIANHAYAIIQRQPDLLTGKKIGEVNRKITLALYFDDGLEQILKSGSKEEFTKWFMNYYTEEEIARAVRHLVQFDYIRLKAEIIRQSERDRTLMASRMRH